jgi:non-homologous end joining protein Ku
MSTTVWKGHVTFGMVSFPVKLQAAARSQSIQFHQLHRQDHSRVKQVLYCQAEDRPVARDELVKGYEYEKDRYHPLQTGALHHLQLWIVINVPDCVDAPYVAVMD